MSLPPAITEKLNSTLGLTGKPHIILYDGQWLDTGCMEWTPVYTQHDVFLAMSPDLTDAIKRFNEVRAQSPGAATDFNARFREFFAKEPPDLQAEFEAYVENNECARYENQIQQARDGGINMHTLMKVRSLLQAEPVQAYLTGFVGYPLALVIAVTTDQFDILRIERTDAANFGMLTEDAIGQLKFLNENFGIDIVLANSAGVEFVLRRIPNGEQAHELEQWLADFCRDAQYEPDFAGGLIKLWWD